MLQITSQKFENIGFYKKLRNIQVFNLELKTLFLITITAVTVYSAAFYNDENSSEQKKYCYDSYILKAICRNNL